MYENQAPLQMARDIYFGNGMRFTLGDKLAALNCKRPYVVFDKGVAALGIGDKIAGILRDTGKFDEVVTYSDIAGEPTSDTVEGIVKAAVASQVDAFVAVGGGSAIDACKGAKAIYVSNPDLPVETWITTEVPQIRAEIPFVVIPTTAGTGSEATNGAMVSHVDEDGKHWKKILEVLPNKYIDFAIVDPELAVGTPVKVSMSCAFDVLAHAWEDYVSVKASPLTKELAMSAIKHFAHSVNRIYADINDLTAREEMALGCTEIGIAMCCAYCGTGHAMGHAIGAYFHLPHGLACGLFIPAVMKWHGDSNYQELVEIASVFNVVPVAGEEPQAFVDRFAKFMYQFGKSLGVDIKDHVATAEECYAIIPGALADYSWHLGAKELTEAEAKKIIDWAYSF